MEVLRSWRCIFRQCEPPAATPPPLSPFIFCSTSHLPLGASQQKKNNPPIITVSHDRCMIPAGNPLLGHRLHGSRSYHHRTPTLHSPSPYLMNRIITFRRSDDMTPDQLPSNDLRNGRSLGSGPWGWSLYAASRDLAGRRDADGWW